MSARPPRTASRLALATSRSRTAAEPLAGLVVESVDGFPGVGELLAGPSEPSLGNPAFPGLRIAPPLADRAVMLRARAGRSDAILVLTLDLGQETDLARLELWGSPLLAAAAPGGHPEANQGLPRALAILVRESEAAAPDRRRRVEPLTWPGELELLHGWRLCRLLRDLRGAWGWTPIHLPACYGRRLMLVMTGLPRLSPPGATPATHGVEIARILAYPFLQGSDHRPHVEHAPVGSWQEAYRLPSAYWAALGVAAPDPRVHQSVLLEPATGALLAPAALAGAPALSDAVGEVPFYASDLLSPAGERAWLVVEAGSDEAPLLEAVRLTFRPPAPAKGYPGPKLPYRPDYRIRIDVTDDREAAHSSDWSHPAWRPVAAEQLVLASLLPAQRIHLVEPARARWLRITARPVFRQGIDVAGLPFVLHRLDLLRPRDWLAVPAPEEDLQVDTVLLRLRGRDLVTDYAFIDGAHGTDVRIEVMREGRAFEELRAFRTLADLVEGLATRVFQNARRIDKPVQRLEESSKATTRVELEAKTASSTDATVRVEPSFNNTSRTRTGALTRYEGEPVTGLTAVGLTTTRTYQSDLAAIVPPLPDPATLTLDQLRELYADYAAQLIAQGVPVSIGGGVNLGFSGGGSFGLQAGMNLGFGLNVGAQAGGGVTRSVVEGSQGTVVEARVETLEARNRQRTTSSQGSTVQQDGTSRDQRSVTRRDLSEEVRRHGMEIRYGGAYEDLILAAVPVGLALRGAPDRMAGEDGWLPLASRDRLRVKVAHLPQGVVLDVEFRGRRIPKDGTG